MSQRNNDSAEASRWKKKFLDVLEDQDSREKSLTARIKLLRRGLVGVSLAGDGLDSQLDRELSALRTALRSEDSEAGLEVLLEHIEKSVLRLDTRKEHSTWALRNALTLSVTQLQELKLDRDLKRSIKQFARTLPGRVDDIQNHAELIVEFLEVVRMVVRQLSQSPDVSAGQPVSGLWRRLFSTAANQPTIVSNAAAERVAARAESVVGVPGIETPLRDAGTVTDDDIFSAVELDSAPHEDSSEPAAAALENTSLPPEQDTPPTSEATPEPGFSAIANHAEPVLLRILENIYVSEQSVSLAQQIRAKVARGLNWYEFVSVLEDISSVITCSLGQERSEFQLFLNELNASLEQVQQYVRFARDQELEARASESELDQAVRGQVSDIAETVEKAADIDELKSAVQDQLDSILSSMDGFRHLKIQQSAAADEHTRTLEARIHEMERESRELRLHLVQQEQNAMRDALTELPNRAAYDRRVRHELEQQSHGAGLCLVICDVDHFKQINDTYGHLAGDKVLKILAKEISTRVRQSDFVARYGGEEFVILMTDTDLATAEPLINVVRQAVESCPFHFKEKQVQITMSFGVSALRTGETPDLLFDRADRALYKAKAGGRNRVCVADVPEESH
ncbi:MAG: GGDEF domain-containing protein [Gammaproteobacteria bacterium]|nr:GGDEF domain-containing protein [Gammaproteobacteria bacterium]MDP2348919.1 GGDEF domain-containing protein [Gammaproteobacteria bacterium]